MTAEAAAPGPASVAVPVQDVETKTTREKGHLPANDMSSSPSLERTPGSRPQTAPSSGSGKKNKQHAFKGLQSGFYYDMLKGKASPSFKSSTPRLTPVRDSGVPPPGSYDIPPSIAVGSSSAGRRGKPFISGSPRSVAEPNRTAGPDAFYDVPSAFVGGSPSPNSRRSSSFALSTTRFLDTLQAAASGSVPGPGTYSPPSSFASAFKKRTASGGMKSASPRLVLRGDGKASTEPALYDPPSSFAAAVEVKKVSSPSFRSTSARGVAVRQEAPPPGSYNPRDAFLSTRR